MSTIALKDIQQNLVGYLHRVKAGETLVILENDEPIAEIKPISSIQTGIPLRPYALCAGKFSVPDDFDAPLPDIPTLPQVKFQALGVPDSNLREG